VTTRGRLGLAALASLVLHALVIAGNWLPLPQQADGMKPLQARLSPPLAAEPQALKPPPPAPRRAAPRAAPPVPEIATAGPPARPDPQPDPQPEAAPVELPTAAPTAPEPPQQLALAAESTAVIAHSLPRRGRITYTLTYGDTRTYVGKVVQEWQAADGTYRISSDAETGGIVELFRPQRLRYVSQGRITREGLRPETFLMSRTRRGQNEVAQARFDWNAGNLAYGYARDPKNAPLPANAQDFMSFIYQFVVTPPAPGRHRVPITTGSRFEVYEIEVSGEESIETPLGVLKALQVKQLPRPGSESIEIWLAADYRYLPVRIRHFDREGNFSGEQVASEIRVSDE
jgi:hypothetical protein